MQKILEEYGGVICVVIAVVGLILVCGVIIGGGDGGIIKESLENFVDSLSSSETGE